MSTVGKILKTEAKKLIISAIRKYIRTKHNNKSDLCIVDGYKESINWSTTLTHGRIDIANVERIRNMVGQNVLMTYGLPLNEKDIPHIYLLITPSVLKILGIINTLKFYKNWRGYSEANEITAVIYP